MVIIDSGVVYVGEQSDLSGTGMPRAVCSMHVRSSYLHNLLIGQCFDDWKHLLMINAQSHEITTPIETRYPWIVWYL